MMVNRSDRPGDSPITRLAHRGPFDPIGSPGANHPSWPGALRDSNQEAEDTFAVSTTAITRFPSSQQEVGSAEEKIKKTLA
jgi:hypothetical protein